MSAISRRLSRRTLQPSAEPATTVADLPRKSRATVISPAPGSATELARRLFDLGFTPGAVVERLQRAPLGDPTVYRVGGIEVALRRREASSILVKL